MWGSDPEALGGSKLSEEERALRCRQCAAVISRPTEIFRMRSEAMVQVFPNPLGMLREIITVRAAWGLEIHGPPTTEFTWFEGYAWEIALCASCRTQVGWRYQAVQASALPEFFGLLTRAVVEG
ncbi:MAG: cereblon family protein [Myxococcota bacterium]